jgi:urate oxidase
VAIALEGDFASAHVDADNANVVATDTMKNTVYAFAPEHLHGSIERFGHVLARHFAGIAQVETAKVAIDEHRWVRIPTDSGPADSAFLRSGDFTRTAVVTATSSADVFEAGLRDLIVMKTAGSAFTGFPRDEYTTLPETEDRLMATKLSASWRYGAEPPADFDTAFDEIGATLLDIFADHRSESVQHSVWLMGRAILEAHQEVESVTMVLPNLHHWLADLSRFGQDNSGEVFIATTEPHGVIEATVRRPGTSSN